MGNGKGASSDWLLVRWACQFLGSPALQPPGDDSGIYFWKGDARRFVWFPRRCQVLRSVLYYPGYVNQDTGEAVGFENMDILTFGGPVVNPVVKHAEKSGAPIADRAPVRFHSEACVLYFQYMNGTNIPNASLPISAINNDEDIFVIERYLDSEAKKMTICYGFGWQGTYAAGKFFEYELYPEHIYYTNSWIIVHWHDTNSNNFVDNPGKGDTYTIIATGN